MNTLLNNGNIFKATAVPTVPGGYCENLLNSSIYKTWKQSLPLDLKLTALWLRVNETLGLKLNVHSLASSNSTFPPYLNRFLISDLDWQSSVEERNTIAEVRKHIR